MAYTIRGDTSSTYDITKQEVQEVYMVTGFISPVYTSKDLKIMDYNVGGWYDGSGANVPAEYDQLYYDLQYGIISDNDPDVLMINEYWEQFSKSGRKARTLLDLFFPYVYITPLDSNAWYGRAFCSKYPISNYQNRSYTEYGRRYYDTVDLNISGHRVVLCLTHLGLSVEERKNEAEELVRFLKSIKDPFICTGDLNTASGTIPTGNDYINVLLPMIKEGFRLANSGCYGRFMTYKHSIQGQGSLDNIITSHNIDINNVYVDTSKESTELPTEIDHMPIIAEVTINFAQSANETEPEV